MVPNERDTHCQTKGIPMFLDAILATAALLIVGAAFNYIGHLASK